MDQRSSKSDHMIDIESGVAATRTCQGQICGFSDAKTTSKDAQERSAAMKKLWIAIILCIIFMCFEVLGGIKSNRLAILTDAAHLLSDVAAFAISLFSLWASGWKATPKQSYGFFRVEILGALVSIQLIWILAGILVYEAIGRLVYDGGEVQGSIMFGVSAFGLGVNVVLALLLGHDHSHHGHSHDNDDHDHGHRSHNHDHGHGFRDHDHGHGSHDDDRDDGHRSHDHNHGHGSHDHDHGHGSHDDDHDHGHHGHGSHDEHDHNGHEHSHHGHDHDDKKVPLLEKGEGQKRKRNINVQGAHLHVLGDFIQSVGVMIGGAVIWWKPEWKIINLICTLFFSVIVLFTTFKMLRSILEVLMESTPGEIDAKRVEEGLCDMDEVVAIHELHIWAITVGKVLLACHVRIKNDVDADVALDKVIDYLRREFNIVHVTIQIERE